MKRSVLLWLAAAAALAAALYAGTQRALTPASAGARASRGTALQAVAGSVTVAPRAESPLAAPLGGMLLESKLDEGRKVKAGEVLAQLDAGQLPFRRQEAVVQLADTERRLAGTLASEVQLEILRQERADAEALLKANFYAPADFEKLTQTIRQLETTIAEERAALATRRAVLQNSLADYDDQLRRLHVVAPYDGVITRVLARPGDLLAPGQPLARLLSRELEIRAEVNQDDVAAVRDCQRAQVRFFALRDQVLPARVKLLLPSSDPATQRFTVLLELAEPREDLLAGLTGEALFVAGERPGALLVPRRALAGTNVVVAKDGRAEIRAVRPGYLNLTTAEILDGVSEGEVVLTENLDAFRDGERVRVTAVADGAAPR